MRCDAPYSETERRDRMIAPINPSDTAEVSPEVRRARRHIAGAILAEESESAAEKRPVPAWKAWLFAVWTVVVVAVYFACMAGLI